MDFGLDDAGGVNEIGEGVGHNFEPGEAFGDAWNCSDLCSGFLGVAD